jgi:hypothetical protein
MKFDIWMLLARLHFELLDTNEHYAAGYKVKEIND